MLVRLVTEIVCTAVYWLNVSPAVYGISISLRATYTGLLPDLNLHYELKL